MLSKSLLQFSVDEQGCVPSLLFPMTKLCIVGVMMVMATSFKRAYTKTVVFSAPDPTAGLCRLTLPPETPGHSQASVTQSLVGLLLLSLWSFCAQVLFVPSKSLFPQVRGSSVIKSHCLPKSNFLGAFIPLPDPQVEKSVVGP